MTDDIEERAVLARRGVMDHSDCEDCVAQGAERRPAIRPGGGAGKRKTLHDVPLRRTVRRTRGRGARAAGGLVG